MLCSDTSWGQTLGLVRRGQAQGIGAYHLGFGGPTLREPLYAPANSFPVRTRIGCAMQCVYCTAANLGRRHANGELDAVLDEIERTVAGARERGVGRVSIFFADDEFNLPDERHPIAVLQGILERGLAKHMTWRAYFNPTPFSPSSRTSSARPAATCRSPSTAPPTRCSRPRRSRSAGAISTT